VEWLGEVPEHWDVHPARFVVRHIDKRNENAECQDYLSLMANIGVIPYAEKGDIGNKKPDDLSKCKLVEVGDIVINSMNYSIGSYGISPYQGVCSPVYVVLKVKEEIAYRRFAFRIFQNSAFQRYAASLGNGILAHRAAIGWDDIKVIGIALPSLKEQESILMFLDEETAKIAALIGEQERLINLLKEKRQAVATSICGRFTAQCTPLRRFVSNVEQGWSPSASERIREDGETAVLKLSAVKRGQFDRQQVKIIDEPVPSSAIQLELRDGDFLVSRANTPELVGETCVVRSPPARTIFSDLLYRLTLDVNGLDPDYLNLFLQTPEGRGLATRDARGSSMSMVKLSHRHVLDWLIPVPELSIQQNAVKDYNKIAKQLEALQILSEEASSLLVERRNALVSAAVTGKIDVRNYTPKEAA
jgi:type I restriction enzyme S subunit